MLSLARNCTYFVDEKASNVECALGFNILYADSVYHLSLEPVHLGPETARHMTVCHAEDEK